VHGRGGGGKGGRGHVEGGGEGGGGVAVLKTNRSPKIHHHIQTKAPGVGGGGEEGGETG